MSLCLSWLEDVLPTGTVYKIATAYFMYNGTAVGQGSVVTSVTYVKSASVYEIQLSITDSSTNTYTYNAILIKDDRGNNVALFQYSQSYSKGTGSLTVTEYIDVQDVPPITEITSQFPASGDWAEILTNALVNGGTVYTPNTITLFNDNYQAITTYTFSPSVSLNDGTVVETQSISCTPCQSISGLYIVLAYYDAGTGLFIWVNYQYVAFTFSTMNVTWQYRGNPNC